jgi:hypothetical protein
MKTSHSAALALAGLAAGGLLLTGCAGTSQVSSKSEKAPIITKVRPHIGGGMMVIAPITVSFQDTGVATDYTLARGQSLVFVPTDASTIADWTVSSDPSGIVDFTAGGTRDGATFNPGIQAVGDGTTTVTITNAKDNSSYTFTVTVSGPSLAPGQVQNY